MQIACGVLLATFGVGLAARSALLLAGRGRPKRGPQPAFVIAGPYRRVRNPLFAGCLVALTGTAVAAGSVAGAGGALLAAIACDTWVRRVEEPRLRARFGPAYRAYLDHVPRWMPRARNRRG